MMTSAEASQTAARFAERDLSVRGTRVRVLEAGSGDPLLYLHDSGDLGQWGPLLSGLAERYTVCRPDHPGFNASADGTDIDSAHELAFFYLDLLDEIGADRAVVIGASLGGWLAADLATIEPRRVSKLVLAGAHGIRTGDRVPDIFLASPAELAELTYHTGEARSAARQEAELLADDAARFERYLRNRSATAHLGWNPYLHDPKLPGRLHRITAPTLILWGAHDRLLPLGHARRWAELLPGAQLTIINDAGHLPLAEQADASLQALWTFCGES
jgi:pimeloyl-ACP methyl ester carboxylesterase